MRNRLRARILAPAAAALLAFAVAAPAVAAEDVVVVTQIDGELAGSMMATLDRAIRRAEAENARAIIIEIDTPGGELTLMDRIGRRIEQTNVQPIAYVVNEAVSAGAYIAMACDLIYTYEHAQIGSSYPIVISPVGVLPEGLVDSNQHEKMLSYLRSKFRDRAQAHDRPGMGALAEAMVDPEVEVVLVADGREQYPMKRDEFEERRRQDRDALREVKTICRKGELLNLTAQEAFEYGFSDGVVASREEVLDAAGLDGARVIELRPSWSERFVGLLDWWLIEWFLFIGALVLIYVELKVPGFGVPGALGISMLALLLFRNYLVGLAEIPEILLVILGIVLLAVEVFVFPGFGAAGIAGITCIALGVIFSFLPFLVPEGPLEASLLADTIRSFSVSVVLTVIGVLFLSRYVLPKTPFFARMILEPTPGLAGTTALRSPNDTAAAVAAGDVGRAASDLRPAGKVMLEDDPYDAVSEGEYIRRGEPVVVVRVEGNRVVVRSASLAGGAGEVGGGGISGVNA